MPRPNNDDIDIYELLDRADELLKEEEQTDYLQDDFEPEFEEPVDMDATIVYRNAANSYGQAVRNAANNYGQPIRNAANNYGCDQPIHNTDNPCGQPQIPQTPPPMPKPIPEAKPTQAEKAVSSIRAYNADFRNERERSASKITQKTVYSQPQTAPIPQTPPPAKPKKQKERKKSGCLTKLIALGVVVALLVGLFNLFIPPPKTDAPLGDRRSGVSTILLCGADIGGERTDTMMLLYVDANKKQAGLLSLPRDTYTVTAYGDSNKLNSAYGRNGGGEEGMEVLFDYVQKIVGFRPDGYILVELPMLRDLVDLMGGVEFEVPQAMDSTGTTGGVHLEAGLQHLDGEQALGLIRFRYGYANQDLGRQDVQKNFLKACLEQWAVPENFSKLKDALSLFKAQSFTDLSTGHFAWFGLQLLRIGFSNIYTDTLPGYATMIGDQSYYVLYPGEVAALIQQRYNPYRIEITEEILDIATE